MSFSQGLSRGEKRLLIKRIYAKELKKLVTF